MNISQSNGILGSYLHHLMVQPDAPSTMSRKRKFHLEYTTKLMDGFYLVHNPIGPANTEERIAGKEHKVPVDQVNRCVFIAEKKAPIKDGPFTINSWKVYIDHDIVASMRKVYNMNLRVDSKYPHAYNPVIVLCPTGNKNNEMIPMYFIWGRFMEFIEDMKPKAKERVAITIERSSKIGNKGFIYTIKTKISSNSKLPGKMYTDPDLIHECIDW